MSLVDKFTSAWYELIAPEKDALLNDSKKLDKEIKENSPLQKSINKIIKLQKSNSWEERYKLNEQLNELKNINKLYENSKQNNITINTKKEIKSLLIWIEQQINLKADILNDDYESIDKIIKWEKDRFDDTIDIISPNTIRDNVEKYIDISWIRESLPIKQYQDFFDIASVTYINILEKIYKKKLSNIEEKALIQNDWLYLNQKESKEFISQLLKNISNKNLYINFYFSIKLKKWNYEEIKTINLQKRQNKLDNEKKILEYQKEEKQRQKDIIKNKELYIVNEALNLIIKYEWFIKNPKWDRTHYSRGYWTKAPWKYWTITRLKAKNELKNKVIKIKKFIEKSFPNINTNQKIALISFFYNNWTWSKWKSNLIWRLKNLNKEVEWVWIIKANSIANMLTQYTKNWWKELAWLVKRRNTEKILFLK